MARISVFLIACLLFMHGSDAAAQNRFWLVNNSGQTIEQVYVSSARESSWGGDILGRSVLPAGNRIRVEPRFRDCVLDIRVVYSGGRADERRNLNACNINTVAFGGGSYRGGSTGANVRSGGGGDPSFSFVNNGRSTIRELYVSSSRQSTWGSDRLGQYVLQPGQNTWVALPGSGGCHVDVRVVYNNGQSREMRNVETCSRRSLSWR